jgi:hypothetical protein
MEGERLVGGCSGNGEGLENFEIGMGDDGEDEICSAVRLPPPRKRGERLLLGA